MIPHQGQYSYFAKRDKDDRLNTRMNHMVDEPSAFVGRAWRLKRVRLGSDIERHDGL